MSVLGNGIALRISETRYPTESERIWYAFDETDAIPFNDTPGGQWISRSIEEIRRWLEKERDRYEDSAAKARLTKILDKLPEYIAEWEANGWLDRE